MLLLKEFCGASLHLFRRDILDVSRERPHVTEGIFDGSRAIAIELILQWLQFLCSARKCFFEHSRQHGRRTPSAIPPLRRARLALDIPSRELRPPA